MTVKRSGKGSAGGDAPIETTPEKSNVIVKVPTSISKQKLPDSSGESTKIKSNKPENSLSNYEKEKKANQKVMRESKLIR